MNDISSVFESVIQKVKNAPKKNAEDLKTGDVFFFRDKLYVSLSNFTDFRHTQTIVTAVGREQTVSEITVFRFFRTFKVPVVHKAQLKIHVMDNDHHEITQADLDELQSIREKYEREQEQD